MNPFNLDPQLLHAFVPTSRQIGEPSGSSPSHASVSHYSSVANGRRGFRSNSQGRLYAFHDIEQDESDQTLIGPLRAPDAVDYEPKSTGRYISSPEPTSTPPSTLRPTISGKVKALQVHTTKRTCPWQDPSSSSTTWPGKAQRNKRKKKHHPLNIPRGRVLLKLLGRGEFFGEARISAKDVCLRFGLEEDRANSVTQAANMEIVKCYTQRDACYYKAMERRWKKDGARKALNQDGDFIPIMKDGNNAAAYTMPIDEVNGWMTSFRGGSRTATNKSPQVQTQSTTGAVCAESEGVARLEGEFDGLFSATPVMESASNCTDKPPAHEEAGK